MSHDDARDLAHAFSDDIERSAEDWQASRAWDAARANLSGREVSAYRELSRQTATRNFPSWSSEWVLDKD